MFVSGKFCDNLIKRLTCHLNGVERRSCCLICQCRSTTVPELHEVIYSIEGRGCIYATHLPLHTLRVLLIIYASHSQVVTRCTRYGIVARQTHIVIQLLTQKHLTSIYGQRLSDRTHGLASVNIGKTIIIIHLTIAACPRDNDVALGVGHLATPMHKVILRRGHTLIHSHLLHLRNIYGVGH